MVGRVNDTPRTLNERVSAATAKLDELSRAIGRPTPALRNDAGHALNLTGQSSLPMLVPTATGSDTTNTAIDSALRFHDGGLSVRDPTDTADRDLTARTFNASGAIGAAGNVISGGDVIGTKFRGDLGAANDGYNGFGTWHGSLTGDGTSNTVSAGTITSGGTIYAFGNINSAVSIGAQLNLIASTGTVSDAQGNVRIAPACERRLKNHEHDLRDPLRVVERWRPAVATWADGKLRELRGPEPFAAVYVDEVADTAPEAVLERGDGTRTTDDRALIAYLTGAVQQLAEQNRELAARVAVLEG